MATIQTLKLVDNDLTIVNGQTVKLTDREALGQILSNALKLWTGSWFKDLTLGTDWLRLLEEGNTDRFKIAFLKVLRADSRVLKVQNLTLSINNSTRHCSGSFVVQTTLGPITGGI